jgi:hypothetical protein
MYRYTYGLSPPLKNWGTLEETKAAQFLLKFSSFPFFINPKVFPLDIRPYFFSHGGVGYAGKTPLYYLLSLQIHQQKEKLGRQKHFDPRSTRTPLGYTGCAGVTPKMANVWNAPFSIVSWKSRNLSPPGYRGGSLEGEERRDYKKLQSVCARRKSH